MEKKQLSLSQNLKEVCPSLLKNASLEKVTLEELVTHTLGISRVSYVHTLKSLFTFQSLYGGITKEDLFSVEVKEEKEPLYSNTGFALLGQCIANHQGLSYEDLVKREILDPLYMKRSFLEIHLEFQKTL